MATSEPKPYRLTPVTTTDALICDLIDGQREITNELRAIHTELRKTSEQAADKGHRLKEPRR